MKSHVSQLLELVTCIYYDAVAKCPAVMFNQRDLDTIESRVEHEGVSFLTITLPAFGKDFERSLATGSIGPSAFRSFKKAKAIPAFLQGMLGQVFDSTTGGLLDEPDIPAIEGIRQMALAFKKIQLECTPERIRKALRDYEQCEYDLEDGCSGDIERFSRVSRYLWSDTLGRDILTTITPKHGPGSTAEGILGNKKYRHRRWHERLEPYFPLLGSAYSVSAYGSSEFESVTFVPLGEESPVKVITVPKTLKSPRIIAMEPVCMQYTQQALKEVLVQALESGPVSAGHVNFTDQRINRNLAMTSSKTGEYATLDLSSASDRVPNKLVDRMLEWHPEFRDAVMACRSTRAMLPSGEILTLRKFASMGSALCFPIEAMYFYTICVDALLRKYELPVTRANIVKVAQRVYVYGDDIVVPVDAADVVSDHLQQYYCKVNADKSFWTGKFRESCGMDAYDGEDVTPTYVRQMPPRDKQDSSAIVSWVATSNLFYKRGYWRTASHMMSKCESILGALPVVEDTCAGLGKVTFQRGYTVERQSSQYHAPEVRTWVASPVRRNDKLDGYGALQKCLLKLESRPSSAYVEQDEHLSTTARTGAVTLKRRWVQPF